MINNLWSMFIPSKGRPKARLPTLLPGSTIVVEPQEYATYKSCHPMSEIIVLPENNKGIAYVRNFILNHCRENNYKWFWMFDDDIGAFYQTVNRRLINIDASAALLLAQDSILSGSGNIGQASLEYAQFAWSPARPVKLSSGYCDVAVAINTENTRFCQYRGEMNLKEDRDFTLQVLKNGSRTMRCSHISFKAPKNGSNEGGLKPQYDLKTKEREAVDRMVKYWGRDICSAQIKADGRYDLKINWKFFDRTK